MCLVVLVLLQRILSTDFFAVNSRIEKYRAKVIGKFSNLFDFHISVFLNVHSPKPFPLNRLSLGGFIRVFLFLLSKD